MVAITPLTQHEWTVSVNYTEKLMFLLETSKQDMWPLAAQQQVEDAVIARLKELKIPAVRSSANSLGTIAPIVRQFAGTRLKELSPEEVKNLMARIAVWEPTATRARFLAQALRAEGRTTTGLKKFIPELKE